MNINEIIEFFKSKGMDVINLNGKCLVLNRKYFFHIPSYKWKLISKKNHVRYSSNGPEDFYERFILNPPPYTEKQEKKKLKNEENYERWNEHVYIASTNEYIYLNRP